MTSPVVAPLPPDATADSFPAIREWLRRAYNSLSGIIARDKTFLGTFEANAASTTFTDSRIASTSALVPQPTTANAAAAMNTWYIAEATRTHGAVTVVHANNAQTDRTFRWSIKGT